MYNKVIEKIKEYKNIYIARHVGPDPDALGSQNALKEAILRSFPAKKVLAVGISSPNYNYFPRPDKFEVLEDALLIVLDTPNLARVDIKSTESVKEMIKIDHHPVVDTFSDIDIVDTGSSSTCEIILKLLRETNLSMNKEIAKFLFMGIVSDTNRFLYSLSKDTLSLSNWLIDTFDLDTEKLYFNIYSRSLNEIKLYAYICEKLEATEHGFAHVYISDEVQSKYSVDASSAGNLVNNLNNIKEVIVWALISDDKKNNRFRVNIRSRGPVINDVAEKFGGGGHKFASGAKPNTKEEVDALLKALDKRCEDYKEGLYENN